MLQVRRTEGDFPHVRKNDVILACGCSTCCCFTLLGGAIGGVAGLTTGIVQFVRSDTKPRGIAAAALVGAGKFLVYVVVSGLAGLCIGAGLGFVADQLLGTFR